MPIRYPSKVLLKLQGFLGFFLYKRPSCIDVSGVARPSTRAGLEKLSHQTEESVSLGYGQREGSGSVQEKNRNHL